VHRGRGWLRVHLGVSGREHHGNSGGLSKFEVVFERTWIGTEIFTSSELQWIHEDRECDNITRRPRSIKK
jgi:hypothetical protein